MMELVTWTKNMPFDMDTEYLMLFDDENIFETIKELTFPESPPDGFDPLIQDIMLSGPTAAKFAMTETDVTGETKKVGSNRCDSCSGACVAPEDVFPGVTQIGGIMSQMSQTMITGLGIETPSDSEDKIDVVTIDSGKRTQHNVLQRNRRADLKNSFFHLRDSVPELEGQERAPKVLILRKASQYIVKLIEDQRKYDREMELLQNKREKMKRQLFREMELLKNKKEKLKRQLSRLRDY